VYRHSNYIMEINGSLTLIAGEITDLSMALSGYLDGTYYFIVVAHNNYGDTLSNCVVITVIIPPPPGAFVLSSDADVPDTDGSFTLNWTTSEEAMNYSVYRHSSYIMEINGSLTLLASGITDLSMALSGYLDGTYYFIVVAHNDYGDTLSNCIKIEVEFTKTLIIISPDASCSWKPGTSRYINWTSTGIILNVKIELYNNGAFVMEVIANTPNDGEFYWSLYSGLIDSKNYQLRILDVSDQSVFGYSDYFEIKAPVSPPDNLPIIFGYDITLLLVAIGVIGAYITRKKQVANLK